MRPGGGETPIPSPITRRGKTGRPRVPPAFRWAGQVILRSAESPREREACAAAYLLSEGQKRERLGVPQSRGGCPCVSPTFTAGFTAASGPDQCPQVGNISAPISLKKKVPLGSWAVGGSRKGKGEYLPGTKVSVSTFRAHMSQCCPCISLLRPQHGLAGGTAEV